MGGRKAWQDGKAYIDQYFSPNRLLQTTAAGSEKKKQSVFMEIHTLSPSLMNISDHLQSWRTSAKAHGMELFVFTSLREPLSWALSAFNYVHRNKVEELRMNANAARMNMVLRDLAQENPQCSFLAHSWLYLKHDRWLPKEKDCDILFDAMKNQIDFVGTTEHHQETIEMLKYLFDLPKNITFIHENSSDNINANNMTSMKYEELTDESIQFLTDISLFDYKLYDNVQRGWKLTYS